MLLEISEGRRVQPPSEVYRPGDLLPYTLQGISRKYALLWDSVVYMHTMYMHMMYMHMAYMHMAYMHTKQSTYDVNKHGKHKYSINAHGKHA
jgi:hypothetical protein